ncbi:aryl-alcohol dehydrogenase-like predicted oxidoreductase [Mucilaginibacter sp. SG538B]|uniref:aldo/keto reductase n=1 Tax=Mucilaginibacter sp. SG538B TaxID=2587021 RepID=UPI00159E0517|nr:aldo/keto reductase [Mucilaginibacter sp. SG538B]NVM66721.1 aryl-alcohol dehydrogenase-like predicted oxidoreductase [Mucilaginibacter sp. SG538B]
MEIRKLGNTDLTLSAIACGTFAIGGILWGGTDLGKAKDAIQASLEHGVTTIDTAPFYGMGLSEEIIGLAIKGRDRSKIQLLTKFGMVWDGSNDGRGDFMFHLDHNGKTYPIYRYASKENVIKEAEECLRRLKTDYIDLFQIHWNDSTTPIAETMEALQKLIDQGKIRAAGVCNYNVDQMKEAQGSIRLASNQVPFSLLTREVEREIIPYALKQDLGIIAYTPMERGLLTGKYFAGARLKLNDHRNDYFSHFELSKVKSLLDRIEPLAREKSASLAQLVLRWATMKPGISTVLAGARNAEQAVENALAMTIMLDADDLALIDDEVARIIEPVNYGKRQVKWGSDGIAIWA